MTGNELRARREEMGLTQWQLSEPLGIAYQNVQKWEAKGDEQTKINAIYWTELAKLLAVSVDAFYPVEEAEEEGESLTITADNGSISANRSTIASGGSSVIVGSKSTMQTKGASISLRPLEKQAIELNREVGNDNILKGFINKLLEIKSIAKDMY